MPLASLDLGRQTHLKNLRLLNFIDADKGSHPNISFHPYTILKTKKSKLSKMIENINQSTLPKK